MDLTSFSLAASDEQLYAVGSDEGATDGNSESVGLELDIVGLIDSDLVGNVVGEVVGVLVGNVVGEVVGVLVGNVVGDFVGLVVGEGV